MPDNAALGGLLELADEAAALFSGDVLRERNAPVSYHVEKEAEKPKAESILRQGSVMFILPSPYSDSSLLSAEEEVLFRAWWEKSLHIPEDGWSLTSLFRAPAPWDDLRADSEKGALRGELQAYKPRALVLFGSDLACYMTRRRLPMEQLVKREWSINHICAFVTWSPADYLSRPDLKRPIWDNLCYIRDRLR